MFILRVTSSLLVSSPLGITTLSSLHFLILHISCRFLILLYQLCRFVNKLRILLYVGVRFQSINLYKNEMYGQIHFYGNDFFIHCGPCSDISIRYFSSFYLRFNILLEILATHVVRKKHHFQMKFEYISVRNLGSTGIYEKH